MVPILHHDQGRDGSFEEETRRGGKTQTHGRRYEGVEEEKEEEKEEEEEEECHEFL